jgi:hypothetical protein
MRIHHLLTECLAPLGQTISRREMLFLFEAYTALLRVGTEVSRDEAWKEQVRKNEGVLLSIGGIQLDKGHETIYLVRDVIHRADLDSGKCHRDHERALKTGVSPSCRAGLGSRSG